MNGLAQIDPAVEETVDMPEPPNLPAELPAPEESTPPEFSAAAEAPQGEQDGLASIFANPRDLYRYSLARANGASEQEALKVGDNGIGKWGDTTATYKVPMVGLPADTPGLEHGKLVRVTGPEGSVIAKVADVMPRTDQLEGQSNIDLNPAAAMAVGHKGGVVPVKWEFVSGSGDVKTDPHLAELPQPMSARSTTGPLGSIVPDLSDAKVIRTNPDGSVVFDKGVTMYPDMSIAVERGGNRFLRTADGRVQNLGAVQGGQSNQADTATMKELVQRGLEPVEGESKAKAWQRITEFDKGQTKKLTGLTGEPSIADLPEQTQQLIREIADYKLPTSRYLALSRNPTMATVLSRVGLYNPDFEAREYEARNRLNIDFTSGKNANNIRSINTVIGHIDRLNQSAEALNNKDWTTWNSVGNFIRSNAGDPRVVRFNNDATAVSNELSTLFKNTGATDTEIKAWRNTINSSESPAQLKATVDESLHLMASRLEAIQGQWQRGMRTDKPFPILDPDKANILQKIGAGDVAEMGGVRGHPIPAQPLAAAPTGPTKVDPQAAIAAAQSRLQANPNDEKAKAVLQRAKDLGLIQ